MHFLDVGLRGVIVELQIRETLEELAYLSSVVTSERSESPQFIKKVYLITRRRSCSAFCVKRQL